MKPYAIEKKYTLVLPPVLNQSIDYQLRLDTCLEARIDFIHDDGSPATEWKYLFALRWRTTTSGEAQVATHHLRGFPAHSVDAAAYTSTGPYFYFSLSPHLANQHTVTIPRMRPATVPVGLQLNYLPPQSSNGYYIQVSSITPDTISFISTYDGLVHNFSIYIDDSKCKLGAPTSTYLPLYSLYNFENPTLPATLPPGEYDLLCYIPKDRDKAVVATAAITKKSIQSRPPRITIPPDAQAFILSGEQIEQSVKWLDAFSSPDLFPTQVLPSK